MMLSLVLALAGTAAPAETLTVSTDRLFVGPGEVLEGVVVTLTDGKITAVAPGRVDGDDGLHVPAITAGMVDLSSRINGGTASVEETEEVTPQYRVADSLDLFSRSWDRQLRQGVTTVVASPFDNNCIGGLSVALKTGGEPTMEARLVKHDVALRGAFGSQPSSKNHPAYGRPTDFYSRRPTTRMGVEWTWRKAFYDALQASGRPERAVAGQAQLEAALDGELPVFAQAWATQDIRTAIYLKEEMAGEGRPKMRLIIDCGAEAWRELDMLVRSGTAVVLPPLPSDGRSGDGSLFTATAANKLHEAGVPLALSSHNSGTTGSLLGDQAALARRGGLPFEAALAAVTITPARLVGVDDRVGTVEVGKDGDLALWNGTPFELSSKVVGVVLDGKLVIDPR